MFVKNLSTISNVFDLRQILSYILCLFSFVSYTQKPTSIVDLSDDMRETSGLIFIDGAFYTFNDSGGEAELYQMDTISGKVSQTIKVEGAKNKDWEAVTTDDSYIYIGDIGNNSGKRKDLVIYKCPIQGLKEGKLTSEKIMISYEDQKVFDNEPHNHEYDGEGLFMMNGKLYLISKNWSYNESKIYEVPTIPGAYKLDVKTRIGVYGKVTDAYFNSVDENLYLIGYGENRFITCIKDFNGIEINEEVTIPITTINGLQTEGICVVGDLIYYTSEEVKVFKALLGRFSKKDFEGSVEIKLNQNRLKFNATNKMSSVKVEDQNGEILSRFKNINNKSKILELEDLENVNQLFIHVEMKNGVIFNKMISL